MKRIAGVLFLCVLALSAAFAEDKSDENHKTFSITVYPVMAVRGWYSAETEIALSKYFSLALEGKYTADREKQSFESNSSTETQYSQAGVGVRFYPPFGREGFFVGTYVDLTNVSKMEKNTGQVNRYNGYSIAGWLGDKNIIGPIVLEVSTGCGYSKNGYSNSRYNKGEFVFMGVGMGVGVAF